MWQRFYEQFERYFYIKIFVTTTPADLVANLLLSSFCPFLQFKSKNQVFNKLAARYRENLCFLFIASRVLL